MLRIIGLVLVGLLSAVGATASEERPDRVFSGTYVWTNGGSDELSADFRSADDGSWKVKFDFKFGGKRRSWEGTARGSLDEGGKISGTTGWNGRTWEFVGTVEGGVLRGSHTEIREGGRRQESGTFEMKR